MAVLVKPNQKELNEIEHLPFDYYQIYDSQPSEIERIKNTYNKKIISFWGCTKPIIGFTPLIDKRNSRMILSENSKYPCSKHGKYCRFQSDGCIKTISIEDIYESVIKLGV